MRFMAVGSEDNVAALYDLRSSSLISKLGASALIGSQQAAGCNLGGGSTVNMRTAATWGGGGVPREHRPKGAAADVAFHPLHPQVAVGCLDGHVYWYCA